MSVSFNEIPSALRVPGFYLEFDSSRATSDDALMPLRVLVCGQQLATATAEPLTPVRVTSAEQAAELFGAGSMLAQMLAAYLDNDAVTDLRAIGVEDCSSGVQAAGSAAITGAATESGTLCLYVGGRRIRCGVTSGDQASAVATALAAAVNAETDSPVTATANSGTVTLTARHKGEAGNDLDLRLNYNGESTPAGLAVALTALHGGTGNPDVDDLIAAMAEVQYHVIAWPWTDAVSTAALEDELADRWGPLKRIEGVGLAAALGTYGELAELGEDHNSKHLCVLESSDSVTPTWEFAAMAAANVAYYGGIDPARPFQTLELKGALPVPEAERFTMTERNLLLFAGISTVKVDAGGAVRIERLITTYRTNASGALDTAYLDLNTPLTLSLLRYSLTDRIVTAFPRHKLADDGTRYGIGQAIVTPKTLKAETIAWARGMETRGIMENIDGFAKALVVERNADDRNRADWLLAPDLVNQFVVGAALMQFTL